VTPEGEEAALLGLAAVGADRSRSYGPHRSQVVDYYGPPGLGTPLTVLHGGFWREAYDRAHLSATAAALAGAGFAVALAEYRRVGGDGGWPATFDDVARAVATAWDGRPAVLLGHSAGGQLALWAAHRVPEAASRVVAVSPVADLSYARKLALSGGAVDELLGSEDALDLADPMRLLPSVRPTQLLHGTADPDVPVALSRRYAAESGCVLRELPGTGHYGPLIPGSSTYPVLLDALRGTCD
jgi:acetyl esterase/lipase